MADMAAGDSYVRFQFFGYQINNWNKAGKLYMTVTDRVLFILTKYYGGGYTLRVKQKRANLSKDRDAKLQSLKLNGAWLPVT